MTEHARGPWRISKRCPTNVLSPNGTMVADCAIATIYRRQPTEEELAANARLISVAPEFLAVAQDAIAKRQPTEHGFYYLPDEVWRALEAAIAKATT
jgi:hypothetical protein